MLGYKSLLGLEEKVALKSHANHLTHGLKTNVFDKTHILHVRNTLLFYLSLSNLALKLQQFKNST